MTLDALKIYCYRSAAFLHQVRVNWRNPIVVSRKVCDDLHRIEADRKQFLVDRYQGSGNILSFYPFSFQPFYDRLRVQVHLHWSCFDRCRSSSFLGSCGSFCRSIFYVPLWTFSGQRRDYANTLPFYAEEFSSLLKRYRQNPCHKASKWNAADWETTEAGWKAIQGNLNCIHIGSASISAKFFLNTLISLLITPKLNLLSRKWNESIQPGAVPYYSGVNLFRFRNNLSGLRGIRFRFRSLEVIL